MEISYPLLGPDGLTCLEPLSSEYNMDNVALNEGSMECGCPFEGCLLAFLALLYLVSGHHLNFASSSRPCHR